MRVYLDDAELPGPIDSLAQAIDVARRAAGAKGRVVVEANTEGSPIPDALLERPESAPSQPPSVQFLSADPRAMVRSAMLDAADLLDRARDDHAGVVAALDAAELDSVREPLDRVLSAWSACVATVRDGGELIGIDLEQPAAGGPSANQRVSSLTVTLMEVKRCLNAHDWAGLGDAVGDDLERQARDWDAMLKSLADSLR